MNIPSLRTIADAALEGTIVGSFTKLGYQARSELYDWSPIDTDLSGQVAIVTGATSGIGKATAAGLLELGAEVRVTSRSQERADEAAQELNAASTAKGHAIGMSLDTGSFDSIREFVEQITKLDGIDIVINNAGALSSEYKTDDQGVELTLATHLIGPYLLVKELRPALRSGARVLFMSSGGMYTQELDVDNIELSEENYRGTVAYARAKRGQVEMVSQLGPEWAPEILMHAMHPGWVDTAGVDAGLPGFGKVMGPLLRTAEQGADTMVWLAATIGPDEPAGQFWLDRKPRRTSYLPHTNSSEAERHQLIEWLDDKTNQQSG